jgi:ketosteroid isomerase-like protein
MSIETNKQIVANFFKAVDAGRPDEAFGVFAEEMRFDLVAPLPVGGVRDMAEFGRFYAEVMAPAMAAPLRVKLIGMTAEGDRVAAETVSECVNTKGVPYRNRYHTLFVIRDGKIIEMKEYLDSAHLQQFLDI